MHFSLAIYSSPAENGAAESAYKFAHEILKQGHQIYRLFFFNDGVLNCADSPHFLCQRWQALVQSNQLDAITCIASAEKRGLVQASASKTGDKKIHPVFNVGGVAQLIDATTHSDRVITFGGE
jgi:tRNA 2-thiouridine synthesizing protein D